MLDKAGMPAEVLARAEGRPGQKLSGSQSHTLLPKISSVRSSSQQPKNIIMDGERQAKRKKPAPSGYISSNDEQVKLEQHLQMQERLYKSLEDQI